MKTTRLLILSAVAIVGLTMTWPTTSGAAEASWNADELQKTEQTIVEFERSAPGLEAFFAKAYGYAVFPNIVKGAALIAGARGKGLVFEQGEAIGRATLTQTSFGLELGGQSYSEIVFFENPEALQRFKENRFEFAAQASVIVADQGAATNGAYADGVALFSFKKKGLMVEASVGGQKFKFMP